MKLSAVHRLSQTDKHRASRKYSVYHNGDTKHRSSEHLQEDHYAMVQGTGCGQFP